MGEQHEDIDRARTGTGGRVSRVARRMLLAACIVVPLLVVLVATAVSGSSTVVLLVLAALGLALGVSGVFRNRTRPARGRGRRGAGAVLAASLAGLAVGGTAFAAPEAPAHEPGRTAAVQPAAANRALAVLATLTVKGKAPLTGYRRVADFGTAWFDVDRNGCDTRDDILRRDLTRVEGGRCKVTSGTLHDPYTGATIHFVRGPRTSTAVQIDHLVPLADAWQTGAQRLSEARRVDLANDPINLLAVDGPTNEAKGDGDAATWLPPVRSFRCTYVAHQIGVKAAYGLWVTPAEKAAMARVLASCPSITVPVSTVSHDTPHGYSTTVPTTTKTKPTAVTTTRPIAVARPTARPTTTPTVRATRTPTPSATPTTSATTAPAPTSTPSDSTATPSASATASSAASGGDQGVVHPGSYCAPAGATGRTSAGTAMVCATASDGRLRWRSAA